jgi:hypothetical protein
MSETTPSEIKSGRLFRTEERIIENMPLSHSAISNVNPNVVTDGAYALPGSNTFGHGVGYSEWPEPVDKLHRNYTATSGVIRDETLVYRSSALSPRHEGSNYRIRGAGVTTPNSSARFVDGSSGDVY